TNVLGNNAFVNTAQNITNTQRYIDGVFNESYPLWQWIFESFPHYQQVEIFHIVEMLITVLKPISQHGNFWERIQEPKGLFKLVARYSNIQQDLQYLNDDTYNPYQNDTDDHSEEEMVFSIVKETVTNLTQVLMPSFGQEDDIPDILMNASWYILTNPVELLLTIKSPICSQLNNNDVASDMYHIIAKVLHLVEKHLDKWNMYEDLFCDISKKSLGDMLNIIIYEYEWKNDFEYVINGSIKEYDCINIASKIGLIHNKVYAVITEYLTNKSHVKKMSECMYYAANSTSGSQL
ncbi:unnamed protein product, partial [Meganyctiphanes norvegica]